MKNKLTKLTALLLVLGLAFSAPLAFAETGDESGEGFTGFLSFQEILVGHQLEQLGVIFVSFNRDLHLSRFLS